MQPLLGLACFSPPNQSLELAWHSSVKNMICTVLESIHCNLNNHGKCLKFRYGFSCSNGYSFFSQTSILAWIRPCPLVFGFWWNLFLDPSQIGSRRFWLLNKNHGILRHGYGYKKWPTLSKKKKSENRCHRMILVGRVEGDAFERCERYMHGVCVQVRCVRELIRWGRVG